MKQQNPGGLYEYPDSEECLSNEELEDLELTSPDGQEIPIYNSTGGRVLRRQIIVDRNQPPCGVLVDLSDIQGLYNPDAPIDLSDDFSDCSDSHSINVEAYPLAFLKTAGNVQADGIPPCFYSTLTEINRNVRKNHPAAKFFAFRENLDVEMDEDENHGDEGHANDHNLDRGNNEDGGDNGGLHGEQDEEDLPEEPMDIDDDDDGTTQSHFQAVKPICSQLYNHITHRVASRAGKHDSQQGTVTAAISGAFASTQKDKKTASRIREYCETGLPSDRFHDRISSPDAECPTACRAEFVYSIDVRALKDSSGRCVFSFSLGSF